MEIKCSGCGDLLNINLMLILGLIDVNYEGDNFISFNSLDCPDCNTENDLGEGYCVKICTKEEIKQNYDEGYKSGFDDGHNQGYNWGYSDAEDACNDG